MGSWLDAFLSRVDGAESLEFWSMSWRTATVAVGRYLRWREVGVRAGSREIFG